MKRCLVLVLVLVLAMCGCARVYIGGNTAPIKGEEVDFEWSAVRVSWSERANTIMLFTSRAQLVSFIESLSLHENGDNTELDAALSKYSDYYFESKTLVVVSFSATSGSNRYRVDGVNYDTSTNNLSVTVGAVLPSGAGTCDMAWWLLFVELDGTLSDSTTVEMTAGETTYS